MNDDIAPPTAPRPIYLTETSPEIGKLAEALAAAQGEIEGAKKDSDNPFYKSRYADLESVWSVCRAPLATHGLAVLQTPELLDPQGVVVATTLAHTSGQWVRSRLRMVPTKADPQGIGSCISYARRYALAAMVGVYQVDDDAESAQGRKSTNGSGSEPYPAPRRADARPPTSDAAAAEPKVVPVDDEDTTKTLTLEGELSDAEKYGKLATAKEIGSLMGALEAAGITTGELKDYVRARWRVTSRTQLRKGQLVALAEWIATYRAPGMEG